MIYIRPEFNRGIVYGDISPRIEQTLQNTFVWCDIDDLNNPIYFYSDRVMYLGMMHTVAAQLRSLGVDCEVDLPDLGPRTFDWHFLGSYLPNQEEAIRRMLEGRYGVLEAPPAFGKTVCMASLTASIGRTTAIIVQAKEPFDQAYNKVRQFTDVEKVGRLSGEVKDVQPVTVCMIQTLSKEINENPEGEIAQWFKHVDVVMVDECHHAAANSYLTALNFLHDPKYVMGFSATPDMREDGMQPFVNAYMGDPIAGATYGEQIEAGALIPVKVFVKNMPEKNYGYAKNRTLSAFQKRRCYQEVYEDYVVYNEYRNKEAIEFAKEMLEDDLSVAMIVSRVEHAYEINRLFPQAYVLLGKAKVDERREVLSKLRRKEIMCVVTTLFEEATDIPSLGAVAILAGGKTEIRLRQRIRSTRTFSGETAKGYYHKTKGYVWYPNDRADFLRSHSNKCVKILREIVKEHPKNELVWVE